MKTVTKTVVRRALAVVAGLALLALLGVLFRPRPVEVDVAAVVRAPLRVTVDEEGKTRIEPRYVVAAPVTGRLEAVTLREGDPVALGQVVARIFPSPLDPRVHDQAEAALRAARASKQEADAGVSEARAALTDARRTLARLEAVEAAGALAPEELDRARTDVEMREESLDAARHRAEAAVFQVQSARAALMATGGAGSDGRGFNGEARAVDLPAPVTGTVLRLFERSERVVQAGTQILELGDPADLEVVVDVLSTDAVSIRPGAEMILDAGGGATFQGRVRRVEPAGFTKISPLGVEEQRVNVIGDLTGAASGAGAEPGAGQAPGTTLGDRYRVEARIVLWEGDDILQAPTGSLFRQDDGWAVFVIGENRAHLRPVTVGHRNPTAAQILDGLQPGEQVVVYPSDRLEDGVRVATRGAATGS